MDASMLELQNNLLNNKQPIPDPPNLLQLSRTAKLPHWQIVSDAWGESGLSQKEFCKQNGLSFNRFNHYRGRLLEKRRLVKGEPGSQQPMGKLLAVQLNTKQPDQPIMPKPFVLQLTGGSKLQIPIEHDSIALKKLLITLGAL
jgi:hypothetical protein